MNRRVHTLGDVFGALVVIVVGCTPPPGPAPVDRINTWTVDGVRVHTTLVLEPSVPPPSGFVENTSTASTVALTAEVASRPATSTVSVSCVGQQAPVGTGLSCAAQGTSVTEFQNPSETYGGVLSGTLTTSGPVGSTTAVFEGILSEQPYGIPDSTVDSSVYDGAPSQP